MWQTILPAAAGLIGGVMGMTGQRETNASNSDMANRANEISVAEASRNRDFQAQQTSAQMGFQERMANTSHQREVKDLKAAGLNPILSAGGGGGPMAQGGAAGGDSAKAIMSQNQNPMLGMQTAMNSMVSNASILNSMKKTNSEKALIDGQLGMLPATKAKTEAETEAIRENMPLNRLQGKFFNALENGFQGSLLNKMFGTSAPKPKFDFKKGDEFFPKQRRN